MIGYYPNSLRQFIYHKQDRFSNSFRGSTSAVSQRTSESSYNIGNADENLKDQKPEFSVSVDLSVGSRRQRANTGESIASSFVQSVVVVPPSTAGGAYSILPGVHDTAERIETSYDPSRSLLLSRDFGHNISNPEIWQQRLDGQHDWNIRKQSLMGNLKREKPGYGSGESSSGSAGSKENIKENWTKGNVKNKKHKVGTCNCRQYHSHTFKGLEPRPKRLSMEPPQEIGSRRQVPEVIAGNVCQLTICNVFWKASLTFCDFKYGDETVEFKSLWPSNSKIKEILNDGIEDTGLRNALWDLCLLSIVSGPLAILKNILDLKYIRLESQFENDPGLLHLACIMQNIDGVQALAQMGVSPKIKDKNGAIAWEVCYCSKTRKQLPVRYQPFKLADRTKNANRLKPGLQDKDAIFKLAANPKCLYELQKKLQMFDFNVNTESNNSGDFLIHIACKAGLCQLPLVASLVRLQQANIDLCNLDGMTPLMIVCRDGDSNFCDVLICVFGANPSKQSEKDKKTALHYAMAGNHVNVVNSLIKRGADVNLEDQDLCRPDDVLQSEHTLDDCREVIQLCRVERCEHLTEMVTQDTIYPINLRPSDLTVVDSDGYTLIMQAVMKDRIHNLEMLLQTSPVTVNAQHGKTGLTALAMAAKIGHHGCCKELLRIGVKNSLSKANIPDIQGYLPLHHAVLNNHEKVVDVFFEFFPEAYVGLHKALWLCRKTSIHDKLTVAWERRQEQIVNPQLRMCVMEGNAEKLFCLLEDGDNVNMKSNLNDQPPLIVAMENSHLEVVRILVEKKADLRRRDPRTGNTVLHIVAKTGHLDTARYLLEFCKPQTGNKSKLRLDINAINNDRKTPLQVAAERGFIRLISLLIENGATTALLNSQGALFTSPEFEGARVQIEAHRQEQTKQVMSLVNSKSKKSLQALNSIWVPRFDHNLRDKHGNTPLMVVCKHGRLEVVKFLLESAVYVNQLSDDESDSNSDADSGVPDLPPWKTYADSIIADKNDDMVKSYEKSGEYGGENELLVSRCEATRTLNPRDFVNSLPCPVPASSMESASLNSYLRDMERPKGLYIYHDGVVSHVCAVNLFDGNSPLHHAIEGGDNVVITMLLLQADSAVINMQNDAGLTPLHLACKLRRKKVLQHLLTMEGIDLSLRTLTGLLADEITSNKTLRKMIQKARNSQPVRPDYISAETAHERVSLTESMPSSIGGSTINFEKINDLFQSIRAKSPRNVPAKVSASD